MGNYSQFAFDGIGRRVKILELSAGATTSTKQFIEHESQPFEVRDATNAVTSRIFISGQEIAATIYFSTKDHLDSTVELAISSGGVAVRYQYDPYGRTTKLMGEIDADLQYTRLYAHHRSELNLAVHREYESRVARWISRDPVFRRMFSTISMTSPNEMSDLAERGLSKVNHRIRNNQASSQRQNILQVLNLYSFVINNPIKWSDVNGTSIRCPKEPQGPQPEDPEYEWNFCLKLCAQFTGAAWEECMYRCLKGK